MLAETFEIPNWNEPTVTCEDNQSCIKTAINTFVQGRSKSHHLMFHSVRACVDHKVMELKYVETKLQLADLMTKPLPKDAFLRHRNKLLVAQAF